MKNLLLNSYFCIFLGLLSGCYCSKIVYKTEGVDHPRWLRGLKVIPHHQLCCGDGKSNQINLYYGFPSDIEKSINKYYNAHGITNFNFENKGQYGIRLEKYISPGFVPYNVLGIGIDYSFSKTKTSFNSYFGNQSFNNQLIYYSNRIALSANLFTLVTRFGLLGYITTQIGTLTYSKIYKGENPDFQVNDPLKSGSLDYRLGYGFQFFLTKSLGISFEGGYGRGAYLRAGLVIWI